MWKNVDTIIQIIDSRIDLISKTIDLYDSQYYSRDNEDFSLQSSHIIREFAQTKKTFEIAYRFKAHCTSINGRFSKSEGCLQSRTNIKKNTLPQFGNEFLPPSKTISLTCYPIIYP